MATTNFDTLFEQLINELMPVYPGQEGGGSEEEFSKELSSGAENMPGEGYVFGKIANALGISREEAIKKVAKDLFDKVFPGGVNKANNNTAFRNSIADALVKVVKDIEVKEDISIPGAGKAVAGYTARIVDQLVSTKKVFDGEKVTQEDVNTAVEKAARNETEEGSAPAPKTARYIDEAEYEILTPEEMSEAGIELSDDLMTYYGRIENLATQVQKGKDIANAISGGEDIGRGGQKVAALIRAGVIKYATPENSDQDIEALEAGEEDIEEVGRKEFERSFGKAYKDYMSSQPGAMNVGFED